MCEDKHPENEILPSPMGIGRNEPKVLFNYTFCFAMYYVTFKNNLLWIIFKMRYYMYISRLNSDKVNNDVEKNVNRYIIIIES